MEKYNFQYCPKLVILSTDQIKILLCKRRGENDYDGIFSFAGGKLEITDTSIVAGIEREKNEELGKDFKIRLFQTFNTSILFRKKDGSTMIPSYYLALHESGDVVLNKEEYSEYRWVPIKDLSLFEPKIANIPDVVKQLLRLQKISQTTDFTLI